MSTTTNMFRGCGRRKGGCDAMARYSGVGSGTPPDSCEGWMILSRGRCVPLGERGRREAGFALGFLRLTC
jgi:hypothetical protein